MKYKGVYMFGYLSKKNFFKDEKTSLKNMNLEEILLDKCFLCNSNNTKSKIKISPDQYIKLCPKCFDMLTINDEPLWTNYKGLVNIFLILRYIKKQDDRKRKSERRKNRKWHYIQRKRRRKKIS